MQKTLYELGDQQRAILETVWAHGGATVRQVRDAIGGDRGLAYTSVLSAMQKLERAGWLRHRRAARSYVYSVTQDRRSATLAATRRFVDTVFGGNRAALEGLLSHPNVIRPSLRMLVDERRARGMGRP